MGFPMNPKIEPMALRDLILFASKQAEKLFRKQGAIYPLYHCIKANGDTVILSAFDADKDLSVAMTVAWMQLNDVDRFVFFDEAWMIDTTKIGGPPLDLKWIERHGVRNHPDRREAVMFSAESRRGEALTAKRYILRPEIGRPTLAPLVIDPPFDHSEGRMVGLLQRGTK
jgi:hypothetical protein